MAGLLLAAVIALLLYESRLSLTTVGPHGLLAEATWMPSSGAFGLAAVLVGSACVTIAAIAVSAPLAILCAVALGFYLPPRLAAGLRTLIDVLAGIPSVVFGIWGLAVLVPALATFRPPGANLLAAALTLALMVLPTIASMSAVAFASVPPAVTQAGAALGLQRAAVVLHLVWPYARPGVAAGVLVGTTRAVGETMAVLMVAGNIPSIPGSLFDPIRTVTAHIALEMPYALGVHRSALFASGAVILIIIIVLSAVLELVRRGAPDRR